MHSRCLLAAALTAAVFSHVPDAAAQQVRVYAVGATSDQPAFEEAGGVGASFVADLSERIGAELGLSEISHARTRPGETCNSFEPEINCLPDTVEDDLTLWTLRAAAGPVLDALDVLRVQALAGFSMNVVRGESEPESSRESDLQVPRTGHVGGLLGARIELQPLERVPLALNAAASSHWISFDGCLSNPIYYTPFCGVDRFTELQAGLSVRFR